MNIYIDVLVIINIYITWILLYLCKSLAHASVRPANLVIASFIGGLSSLLILIEPTNVYVKPLIFIAKVFTFAIIVLIAFSCQPIKKMFVYGSIFIGLNALLCGAVKLFCELFNMESAFVFNGTIYIDIPLIMLILTTAGIYITLTVFSRLTTFKYDKHNSYNVEFSYKDTTYNLPAIADTGNTAIDIFSGKPVIVCNGISLCISETDYIRPIPYSTVSGEGVLYAFKPEYVLISDEKGRIKVVDTLVASTDATGERCAIFNPKLLT